MAKDVQQIILAIFFSSSAFAFAKTNEAIEQARKSILEKDRPMAIQILKTAREKADTSTKAKIDHEAERMGALFFTELGQRDYELGESLFYSQSTGAEEKYQQAKDREGDNFLIISGLVRLRLSQKECAGAQELIDKATEAWPYWPEFQWLKVLAMDCAEKTIEAVDEKFVPAGPGIDFFVKMRSLEALAQSGRTNEAQKLVKALAKEDANYPELYYQMWVASRQDAQLGSDEGEKYLNLCRTLGAKERRKYKLVPTICSHAKEVANAISQKESLE